MKVYEMGVGASVRVFVPEIRSDLWDHLKIDYHQHANVGCDNLMNNSIDNAYPPHTKTIDTFTNIRKSCVREYKDHLGSMSPPACPTFSHAMTNVRESNISALNLRSRMPPHKNEKVQIALEDPEYDSLREVCIADMDDVKDKNSVKASSSSSGQHSPGTIDRYCTVNEWLRTNYEFDSKFSVKRVTVYRQYYDSCIKNGITPVNSACLGKALRSVFPDVKTRRLGVRGESRYHYCGIRLKKSSEGRDGSKFMPKREQESKQIR